MNFSDHGEMTIENFEFTIDGVTYYLFLKVRYEVDCYVLNHDHGRPVGEDYPDGAECRCIDVTVDDYEVWGDDTILDIVLTKSQLSDIESSLYEAAEEHYSEYGSWGM